MTDEGCLLKPALAIEQQIHLLKERGMIISDIDIAGNFLLENNYYRLNIYFHKMMVSNNKFREGTTFSQVMDIYENDKWLRNAIIRVLEPIEIKLKTMIAYYLGRKYGPVVFYKGDICIDKDKYQEVFCKFQNEIYHNQYESVILHHKEKFGGFFPIWVIVEFLSFNTISKYFKNLNSIDKNQISKAAFKINSYYLGNWTQSLSVLRNICAHYGYLYKRELSIPINLGDLFSIVTCDNRSLFSVFIIMRRLSNTANWKNFIADLVKNSNQRNNFILDGYGFPENWLDYLS